jgi:hypothetical protein
MINILDPYDFPYRRGKFEEWAPPLLREMHPSLSHDLIVNENIAYSATDNKLDGKNILIIGGGGSTNRFDLNNYDVYWSMNSFFLNEKVRKLRLQLIGIGAGVDLHNRLFLDYVEYFRPILAFEIHPAWVHRQYNHLGSLKMCYHTSLYGKIGMGIRLVNLAAALGAATVSFIGFDGPEAILQGDHAFEPGKTDLPSLVSESNARFVHKHQYDFCWKRLMITYPFTKFISLDKDNYYHQCLLS